MSQQSAPAPVPDRQPLNEHAAAFAGRPRSPVCGVRTPETPAWSVSPGSTPVSPEHGPRRSQVVMVEPEQSQLEKLTATETHRLDRAIVAISANPALGRGRSSPRLVGS